MWEALERLRPTHLVIYPSFFSHLSGLPVLQRVHSINLRRETLLGDQEKVAYQVLWERAVPAGQPRHLPEGKWTLVDVLDVADIPSEQGHHYRADHGDVVGSDRFALRIFDLKPPALIDGGRCYARSERFTVSHLVPRRPLLVGVRSSFHAEVDLDIRVDGRPLTTWRVGLAAQRKDAEGYLTIPAERVSGETLELEVALYEKKRVFTSYHYFFFQPAGG